MEMTFEIITKIQMFSILMKQNLRIFRKDPVQNKDYSVEFRIINGDQLAEHVAEITNILLSVKRQQDQESKR